MRHSSCIELHKSLLSRSAHCRDFDLCLWLVMEIQQKELDEEWCGTHTIHIKYQWMDLHAGNCWLKVLIHYRPLSCIAQVMSVVVDH
jgi:hypothetical protein